MEGMEISARKRISRRSLTFIAPATYNDVWSGRKKGKKKKKTNCAITGKQAAGRIHPEVVSTVEEQLGLEQKDRLHVTLQCSGYPRAAWGQEVWFHFIEEMNGEERWRENSTH